MLERLLRSANLASSTKPKPGEQQPVKPKQTYLPCDRCEERKAGVIRYPNGRTGLCRECGRKSI